MHPKLKNFIFCNIFILLKTAWTFFVYQLKKYTQAVNFANINLLQQIKSIFNMKFLKC